MAGIPQRIQPDLSLDALLEAMRQKNPNKFVQQMLDPEAAVTCYVPQPNAPWKIWLPTEILGRTIEWYHVVLGHTGMNNLYKTMCLNFYHPDLRNRVEDFVSRCTICQMQKQQG